MHSKLQNTLLVISAFALYAIFATATLISGYAANTPCASDFEGGCGYAKFWLYLGSWLVAAPAAGSGIGIGFLSVEIPKARWFFIAIAVPLTAPPMTYFFYGVYTILS